MTGPSEHDTEHGYYAECTDCPYVIEPAFGARKFPRVESPFAADVAEWVDEHVRANVGHRPTTGKFTRWTTAIADWDPKALELVFGHAGDEDQGAGDQDRAEGIC